MSIMPKPSDFDLEPFSTSSSASANASANASAPEFFSYQDQSRSSFGAPRTGSALPMQEHRRTPLAESKPRAVQGGIKAQSRSGSFGQNWWAKRWLAVLESFRFGARLARGRLYARDGQVLSIEVEKGGVRSLVQGSRATPYEVSLCVRVLSPHQWDKVLQILTRQALFVAKLLASEMPGDIEGVFRQARLSLFPMKRDDLKTSCTCPDEANPCKHIAAVYYLLGEEFDRDPFLLFQLRGLGREELLARLGQLGGTSNEDSSSHANSAPEEPAEPTAGAMELPVDPALFWGQTQNPNEAEAEYLEDLFGEVETPPVTAIPLRRLGKFPLWRGRQPLLEVLEPTYRKASTRALSIFLGETVKG